MLSDPQSVTVNSVAKSLPCVERAKLASRYLEDDGEHELVVSSTVGKRDRSVARINHTKTAADPLTAQNAEIGASVYLVMDRPPWGYTPAEIDYLVQGLCDWLTTANVTAILGGQS
jgi:hypothetical protein